jgi:hypothetical protein
LIRRGEAAGGKGQAKLHDLLNVGGGEEHVALSIWNLIVRKNTYGDLFCWGFVPAAVYEAAALFN